MTPEKEELPSITLDELKEYLELQRITFFEVSSRHWNSDPKVKEIPAEADNTQLHVFQKVEESKISVRCRMTFSNTEGQLIADVAAIFEPIEGAEPREVSLTPELLKEFTEEVGVPIVYPYLREALHEGARKVRIKAPLLGLASHGSIKLEPTKDNDEE